MSLLSPLDLIRRIPLFATLAPTQASLLSEGASKRRYRRGDILTTQGERSDALFVVLTGKARVIIYGQRQREVIVCDLQPGDCVGELSLIDNQPHSATVRVDSMCDVLVLDSHVFARLLSATPAMAYALMHSLAQRLRQANRKIQSLALSDVYGRVATALIDMAECSETGTLLIKGRVSRQDLSKTIGASREMVSRVMKFFEQSGFIQISAQGSTTIHQEHLPDLSAQGGRRVVRAAGQKTRQQTKRHTQPQP